ncbi:MAG: ATP-binding cassette domain-containing protein [Actinomycetota bacterium]
MTAMTQEAPRTDEVPLVELRDVSKYFGTVIALKEVSTRVTSGEVMCLLGDNGAGKSTLIKILSGCYRHDEGELLIEGEPKRFNSPREAMALGIATVHQDLAMIPLMSITRNFFLGSEPTKGVGPLRRVDFKKASDIARDELNKIGIDVRDTEQLVGTLSGGERQSVAIARAAYFGAKLLILDEPTSALGVKEAAVVLRYIAKARSSGLAVIFITHNVHHAYPIGDRFTILNRGQSYGTFDKDEVSREDVLGMMAGGQELEKLSSELEEFARAADSEAEVSVAKELREEASLLERPTKDDA